jgi:hypothetical protein
MGKYILNQETQKIELHFDKSEYMALSDEQKKEIKSNFLWSRTASAWVSRSIHYHGRNIQIAEKLGLENGGKVGERLSYAEELERKAERAEARAERMEQHADNAEKRAESLQAELNRYRGDTAFFTQPIIIGHAGSQAFARRRERIFDRYRKGFDEYRKSEYFRNRAETARATASGSQLKDAVYLHNRIKECNAAIKKLQGHIVSYEEQIHKIQQGEEIYNWITREPLTVERLEECIQERLEKMEYEIDKLAFLENKLDEIGGNRFSKDNIKVGYIVKMKRWGRCEVISAGPVNVTFKILDGGAAGGCLTEPYAAIVEILEAKEPEAKKVVNPYQVGDILTMHYGMDTKNPVYRAYQVIKTTETGVKLQEIAVKNGEPIKDSFTGEKATQKKVVKSKWSEWIGVYMDDWQLHKYEKKEMAGAV